MRAVAHIGYHAAMHRPAKLSAVAQDGSRLPVTLSTFATRWREFWKGYWRAPRGC